jgi:hypothetical protein
MKSFKFFASITAPCCLAALCVFSGQASGAAIGATIEDSYGVFSVNFLNNNPVTGALPGFNPALGTLDGAVFTFDSSAVLIQGTALSSEIEIEDSTGTLLTTITFGQMVGRDQQVETGSFTVPTADLGDFQSAGNVDLTIVGHTACRGSASTPSGCNEFSGAVDGQVTYTYTPASVPEPASLPLFASGLVAAILATRCREARRE